MGTTKKKTIGAHAKKIHNQRIVELIAEYIALTNETEAAVYEKIGIIPQNIRTIKNGTRSFTVEQVTKSAQIFRVPSDWILGITDNRSTVSIPMPSAIEELIDKKIKEALSKHLKPHS